MGILPFSQTAALLGQLIDTRNSTVAPIEMTSFKPKYNMELNGERLERCTPESVGISSGHIEKFLSKVKNDKSINIQSITIARWGKIICEVGFGTSRLDVWKHSFSACKSVISIAIGMLIDDGLLKLDEKIVNIFPKEANAIAKIKLKDLSVEDLLTMRSTVQFAEADVLSDTDWVKSFLNSATKGEIGKTFKYNSLNSYMLSAIVVRKTGKSLTDFLKERLFEPLGIEDFYFEKCPKGIEKGGWGFYIRPEDFVKIGTLVVNGGVYNGKRIISEEYVNMATLIHVDTQKISDLFSYGYQIWVSKDESSFLFNGMLGQNVSCFKNNGIVIVSHAGNCGMFQESNLFKYANEFFARDFNDKIAENDVELKLLKDFVRNASVYTREEKKPSLIYRILKRGRNERHYEKHFDFLNGKTFKAVSGDYMSVGFLPFIIQTVECSFSQGFSYVKFIRDENGSPELIYCENDLEIKIPLGFLKAQVLNIPYKNDNYVVAVQSKFTENEDGVLVLVIYIDFLETPSRRIIKLYYKDEETLELVQSEAPGEDFLMGIANMFLADFSDGHILNTIFDKFGEDFLEFKFRKMFRPSIELKLEKYN